MKLGWKAFLVVAVIGFALGGAFALVQFKSEPSQPPAAAGENAVPVIPPPPAPPVAVSAEPPVLEGVPPMPEAAAGAVPGVAPGTAPGTVPEASPPAAAPASAPAPEAAPKPAAAAMPGVQVGGPFALTDHNGNPVTEKSWPGKSKLVFFGFTTCPDICPTTLQKIAAVMEAYDPKGEKLVPLLITVDPVHDTPPVLAAYVAGFNPHIVGLTGMPGQIKAVEEAYKVYSAPAAGAHGGAHPMTDHSSYVYLMSPDDKLLEVFSASETAEAMIAKIKLH